MEELTLSQPILFILHTMQLAGFEIYIVGGATRDLLVGRDITDWDFTTNATPDEIRRVFPHNFYDNDFGTVSITFEALFHQMQQSKWRVDHWIEDRSFDHQVFEITTFRQEFGYTDRRRPDKFEWGKSIEDDLSRRDFTINALAIQIGQVHKSYQPSPTPPLNGILAFAKKDPETQVPFKLIDPFNGQKDLGVKVIRAVGDPHLRFQEDALRMMRAIRFGAQLGFIIDTKTQLAIVKQAKLIKEISWERRRDELLKILASNYPADGVQLLFTTGLLTFLIPELLATKDVKQGGHHIYDVWKHSLESLRHCASSDPIVRLATLLHDIGKPPTMRLQGPRGVTFYGHEVVGARIAKQISQRLRLSNKDIDRIFILVRWHMFTYDSHMTDAAIRRFIKRVGLENINDMILLRVGDRKGGGSKATSWRLRELQERIGEQLYEPMSLKDLAINGSDLMHHLDLAAGPIIGKILNQLFEEVIEDSSHNQKEWLLEHAQKLVSELQTKT